MAQISVILRDHTGVLQTPVELPDNVIISRLIPALVDKMGLPAIGSVTRYPELHNMQVPIYALYHSGIGRCLRDQDTLAGAGVKAGDHLALFPSFVTWDTVPPAPIEATITLVSGKRFRDTAVVVAFQVGQDFTALIIPKRMQLKDLKSYIRDEIAFSSDRRTRPTLPSPDEYSLYNETACATIDTNADLAVGDVICTGDWISIKLPDHLAPARNQEQDLLDQIKIYAEDPE